MSSFTKNSNENDIVLIVEDDGDIELNTYSDDDDSDEENDVNNFNNQNVINNLNDNYEYSSINIAEKIHSNLLLAESHATIKNYFICVVLQSVFLLGPLAVLEGMLRCFILLFFVILTIFGQLLSFGGIKCCQCEFNWFELTLSLAQETLITIAAVISFLVPAMPITLYRNIYYERIAINNDTNDTQWELAALPTIIGWVDVRRFMCFAYFQHIPKDYFKTNHDSWKTKYSFFPDEILESISVNFLNSKLTL